MVATTTTSTTATTTATTTKTKLAPFQLFFVNV
jgi:hypothetical protein